MQDLFTPERLLALWNAFYEWISVNIFVGDNAIQLGIMGITLGMAAFFARHVARWLAQQAPHPYLGRYATIAQPLALPMLWLVLHWIAIAAATQLGQPSGVLRTAATLLAAWVAIRFATQLVRNPVWEKLIAWSAWSVAALSILELLDPAIALLDAAAIEIGQLRISLYTVVKSTIALAVLLSIAIYVAGLLESRIRSSRALSPTIQVLFTKSLKIVLIAIAVLISIRSVGIDLTALAVVGGALGLGLGFGLQKTVGNLISGVILLIDRSIKPGDVIAVAGTYGWVTALGGRYVSVVTRDGVEHLIPNETLISERVENWTHTNSRTRLKVDLGVHYDTDLDRVIEICEAVARQTPRVLAEPDSKCLFVGFGDSALDLQLRFWIGDAQNGVQNVKSAVLLQIWRRFRDEGIEIPYPQRDLHIRSGAEGLLPQAQAAQRSAA